MPRPKRPPISFSEVEARRQVAAEGSGVGYCSGDPKRARCRLIKKVGHLDLVEWLDPPFSEFSPSLVFGFTVARAKEPTNQGDACPEFGPNFEIATEAFASKEGYCKSASVAERKLTVSGIPVVLYIPNEPFWALLFKRRTHWQCKPIANSQALLVYQRLTDIGAACKSCCGVSGKSCDLCHGRGFVIPVSEAEAAAMCPWGVRWGSLEHVKHEQQRKVAMQQGVTDLGVTDISHIMENLARG